MSTNESKVQPLIRYGKPYADVWKIKTDFYEQNDVFLQDMNRIAAIYRQQPRRTKCMVCGAERNGEALSFQSHGIEYFLCPVCGHLNGTHELTAAFSEQVYENDDYGSVYRERKSQEAYDNRMRTIYLPKAQFMVDALRQTKSDDEIHQMKYLDVGAGSGYYVSAMQHLELRATGMEISASQVNWGSCYLPAGSLVQVEESEVSHRIREAEEEVLSFIGVFEHIENLQDVIRAIAENPRIRYIYFSVPMFSYSAILESIHPDVFNRQLGGTHTHLFTKESLQYLMKRERLILRGAWYFGTDVADAIRMVMVESQRNDNTALSALFKDKAATILDALQHVIDEQEFCSEVHMLVEKHS